MTVMRRQSYCKGSVPESDNTIFKNSDVSQTLIVPNDSKCRRRKSKADRNESSGVTSDYLIDDKTVSDTVESANKMMIESISDYDSWTEVKRSPAEQKINPTNGMQKTRSDKDSRERCIITLNAAEPQASNLADRIVEDNEFLQILTLGLFDVEKRYARCQRPPVLKKM